jgi:hypothetical protein
LSKKLKNKVKELCGFSGLNKEERSLRAYEILNSKEEKQFICSQILGCTHKDIDKIMNSIVQERALTDAQIEQIEMQKYAPEKIDPDYFRSGIEKKNILYTMISEKECLELMKQSLHSKAEDKTELDSDLDYSTYSEEEVYKLINNSGEEFWDLTKTTEYGTKTKNTIKRTKRTKTLKK